MDLPQTLEEMETRAYDSISDIARKYFSAEAGDIGMNERALRRFHIRPHVLRDVSSVDTSLTLLGDVFDYPIGISPTGHQNLAHPDAEIATASAAAAEKSLMITSCASSQPLRDISRGSTGGDKWMQMYFFNDHSITRRLVESAEQLGYRAIVVTVDSPGRPQWTSRFPPSFFTDYSDKLPNVPRRISMILNSSFVFEDLWLMKTFTNLPIVVKGVLSGADAIRCAENGASAILVSNHGARQLRGVMPSIYALEEVVQSLRDTHPSVEVYFDGGVRSGRDVFTALALGAKAVFVGRPVIWGLAAGGEAGVRKVLQILKSDFSSTLQLAGAKNLKEITKKYVWHQCRCGL